MGLGKGHSKRVQSKHASSSLLIPQPSGERVICESSYEGIIYVNNKKKLHNEVGAAVIHYDNRGNVTTKNYYKNGILWRDDGKPAENYYRNGYLLIERWHVDGHMGRDNDKPTEIRYYENGQVEDYIWSNNKEMLHREDDKPAIIRFHDNGLLLEQEWYKNGSHYVRAEDSPNSILYYRNGNTKMEQWVLKNNKKTGRKKLKPSLIEYHDNGIVSFEERRDENGELTYGRNKPTRCYYDNNGFAIKKTWIKNGVTKREKKYLNKKLHNTSGPALTVYDEIKKETVSKYYLFGINYTKDDYKKRKKELNIH